MFKEHPASKRSVTKRKPVFGIGIGNWKIKSIEYSRNSIVGYTVPYHVHNDFLQITAEIGVIGGLLYLMIYLMPIYRIVIKLKDGVLDNLNLVYFLIISTIFKSLSGNHEISIQDLQNDASLFFKNIHKDDIDMFDSTFKDSAKTLKDWNIEYRVNVPKKGLCWLRSHSKPEKLDDGTIIWYGAVTDITNLKTIEIDKNKNEQLLLQQSKMAAMGEMLGNIAHQWRQPLSTISTAATGAKLQKEMDCLTDNELYSALTSINTSAQHLSSTIDDFRDFIKGERQQKRLAIKNLIEKFVHLIEASAKIHDIQVVLQIEEDFVIKSYENELLQCFMNLFNNSKDILF